jgi:hypothetical protein
MQMFRAGAITGRPDYVNAWFADRQGGRWAEQTIRRALPHPERERRRKELDELHEQGVITDAELTQLRARAGL